MTTLESAVKPQTMIPFTDDMEAAEIAKFEARMPLNVPIEGGLFYPELSGKDADFDDWFNEPRDIGSFKLSVCIISC